MPSKRENLALLGAGALISALIGYFFTAVRDLPSYVLALSCAVAILLLPYGVFAEGIHQWFTQKFAKYFPRIGVLSDMKWDQAAQEIRSYTDYSPQDWYRVLGAKIPPSRPRLRVGLIDRHANFQRYVAIVNPYGGVCPEDDPPPPGSVGTTMGKIVEYVGRGGIYVNVADIPGYYAYSLSLQRRVDTTPFLYTDSTFLEKRRPFELTPLMFKLGLQPRNVDGTQWNPEYEPPFDRVLAVTGLEVDRAVVVESNVQPLIEAMNSNLGGKPVQVTPFFVTHFGKGIFMMSLLNLAKPANTVMRDNIAKATVHHVMEKIRGRR